MRWNPRHGFRAYVTNTLWPRLAHRVQRYLGGHRVHWRERQFNWTGDSTVVERFLWWPMTLRLGSEPGIIDNEETRWLESAVYFERRTMIASDKPGRLKTKVTDRYWRN